MLFAVKAARAFTGRFENRSSSRARIVALTTGLIECRGYPDNWGQSAAPRSTAFYRGMAASVLDEAVVLRFNDAETAHANSCRFTGAALLQSL